MREEGRRLGSQEQDRAEASELGLRKVRAQTPFSVVIAVEGEGPCEQSLKPAVGGA